MTYTEAIACLNSFVNFERLPDPNHRTSDADIERFEELLRALGSPHRQYPVIHVAGTKGKGTTAALLASVLRQAGYRTGLYTSPHLITVRERIRTDGGMITKARFARQMQTITQLPAEIRLGKRVAFRTVFEHLTTIAFLEFAQQQVDVAVVETGLGGRLDSTVVVDPVLSIITPIGLDHTAILGETIAEIASEKSFIIKPNRPAVFAPQTQEANEVLANRVRETNSNWQQAPGSSEFRDVQLTLKGIKAGTTRGWLKDAPIRSRLRGRVNLENISVVLTAVEALRQAGFNLTQANVLKGLEKPYWLGRLQVLPGKRLVICDGAHNALGIGTVIKSIKELLPGLRFQTLFAAQKSKPAGEMLNLLSGVTRQFHLAPLQFPKSLTVEMLEDLMNSPSLIRNARVSRGHAQREGEKNSSLHVLTSFGAKDRITENRTQPPFKFPPSIEGGIDSRISGNDETHRSHITSLEGGINSSQVYQTVEDAWQGILDQTPPEEPVLITGSLYLIGEILRLRQGLPVPYADGRIDDRI